MQAHMDLESLKDPALLPESIEARQAKEEKSKKAAAPGRTTSFGCCGP